MKNLLYCYYATEILSEMVTMRTRRLRTWQPDIALLC